MTDNNTTEVEGGMPDSVIIQFENESGETGDLPQVEIPTDTTPAQLNDAINVMLENREKTPYTFFVEEKEVAITLGDTLPQGISGEKVVRVVYQEQALFKVRPVTRCTSTLPGHTEAVISVSFSPNGKILCSGSGDATIRIWDLETETPKHTMKGHTSWVLCMSFAPNGKLIASGGMDKTVRIWDPINGKPVGRPLQGHKKWITSISWEPQHLNKSCNRLVSSSKDASARIWNLSTGRCEATIHSHKNSIQAVKWGGEGLIYTASQDRDIYVWAPDGRCVRQLRRVHAHWVTSLALNTDYVLRTGAVDHTGKEYDNEDEAQAAALARYNKAKGSGPEILVSGSDDHTACMWSPSTSKDVVKRLTGHQAPINSVTYSPDGRLVATASFDKSVKVWNGTTGTYVLPLSFPSPCSCHSVPSYPN
eukprot:TRINITY_DN15773_c0_g1_i1.p1 TRINITY_DN15773_c0_g1~~TRINITY_DN15773_c0_g1_i1.p1  ORF type:complete len:470 (+),score=55.63 TRINITY_DN15773_c0_g1_i1:150-1412(+)